MSYRAIADFWDGPTLYRAGDDVPLSGASVATLVRMGKIEEVNPAPAPTPAPVKRASRPAHPEA